MTWQWWFWWWHWCLLLGLCSPRRFLPHPTKLPLLCVDQRRCTVGVPDNHVSCIRCIWYIWKGLWKKVASTYYSVSRTHPQEQMPIAFSPRLIFCPSDTRNCPSLTASPTFYTNFWKILLMKVLKRNGPSPIAAKIYLPWRPQNIVQKSTKTEGDMCCVCLWAADYSPASSPLCLFLLTKPTHL